MNRILQLVLISLVLFTACKGENINPALKMWKYYELKNEKGCGVNPYINNITAIYMLQKSKNIDDVKHYIQWYFDHLNYPDKNGLTGSMYDYYITQEGAESTDKKYDSVDSYAATFLILLNDYYKKTNDPSIIKNNWEKITDIAYLIAMLQDKDGLTKALPDTDAKYLMDNCECYGGLAAYSQMAKLTGSEAKYYQVVREAIKQGIMGILFNKKEKHFYWGLSGNVKNDINENIFYPDSFSQIFVILYGILDGNDEIKNSELWNKYGAKHKDKMAELPLEQRIIIEMTLLKMR